MGPGSKVAGRGVAAGPAEVGRCPFCDELVPGGEPAGGCPFLGEVGCPMVEPDPERTDDPLGERPPQKQLEPAYVECRPNQVSDAAEHRLSNRRAFPRRAPPTLVLQLPPPAHRIAQRHPEGFPRRCRPQGVVGTYAQREQPGVHDASARRIHGGVQRAK